MRSDPDEYNGRNPDTGKLEDDSGGSETGISLYSEKSRGSRNSRMSQVVADRYKRRADKSKPESGGSSKANN
jgi:hypothetical protein